jgi:hypothetical protein
LHANSIRHAVSSGFSLYIRNRQTIRHAFVSFTATLSTLADKGSWGLPYTKSKELEVLYLETNTSREAHCFETFDDNSIAMWWKLLTT